MAYVITQACCNDASCVEVCPVDCIRPTPDDPEYATTEMLYIEPGTCIDCGACVDACPVDAIFPDDQLTEVNARYETINAEYFEKHPLQTDWDSFEPATPVAVPKEEAPLRVAIVGSGPAACYAAADLVNQGGKSVEVEMFDRLPTPWGLVRAGVAPDHPGTKVVTDVFRWTVTKPSFQFHLNVEVGKHVSHEELMDHHHAVIYAVGASSDRRLGIPGEDLPGSHAATTFVAWYNGHPDYAGLEFDLSGERAVIIGNGNVALDVARVLLMDPDELARTDIADHALAALRKSNIREVVLIGRRGPAQAAYTNPELIALGQLEGVDVVVDDREAELDEHSRAFVDGPDADHATVLKTKVITEFAQRPRDPGNKRIVLRYLASPTEILGDDRVEGVRLVRNELVPDEGGALRARPTGDAETVETGLLLRSIGYRGTAVRGVPFDDKRGVIPNEDGRVIDLDTGEPLAGVYTTGWIKRGPSGVIGTNKKCAQDTVKRLLEDFTGKKLTRPTVGRKELDKLIEERQPDVVDYRGWEAIDKAERERGKEAGRPRVKMTDVESMLAAARKKGLSLR